MSALAIYSKKTMLRTSALLGILAWGIAVLFLLSGCGNSEQTHSLSGRVTVGSSALAGVMVTLSGDTNQTTTTDAAGNFAFNDLPVGKYLLTPSYSSFTFNPVSRMAWLSGIDGRGFDFSAYYPNHLAITDHTMFLDKNAKLQAWGNNSSGQLGNGTVLSTGKASQVNGLPAVISVANGANHTVALAADGTVWTWGANEHGQLGDGSTTQRNTPAQVSGLSGMTAIAAGFAYSLALRSDGTVWAWGSNSAGQLGNNTTTDSPVPVQVLGVSGSGFLGNVRGIAAGHEHAVVMAFDNTVWTWGANANGQLGNATTTNSLTPIQVSTIGSVVAIAAGAYHTVALHSDVTGFTVWCWGKNSDGQLGDGTTSDRTTPVAVIGLPQVTTIAAGVNHTVAVLNDGTVRAWGGNGHGQLGNGTTVSSASPVAVSGLAAVLSVAAGNENNLALSLDNSLWGWGNNANGQLGDGSTISSSLPVRVTALP